MTNGMISISPSSTSLTYVVISQLHLHMVYMKWRRYRRVISLEIQVGITSQITKWLTRTPGNTGGGIRCQGGVSIPC